MNWFLWVTIFFGVGVLACSNDNTTSGLHGAGSTLDSLTTADRTELCTWLIDQGSVDGTWTCQNNSNASRSELIADCSVDGWWVDCAVDDVVACAESAPGLYCGMSSTDTPACNSIATCVSSLAAPSNGGSCASCHQ